MFFCFLREEKKYILPSQQPGRKEAHFRVKRKPLPFRKRSKYRTCYFSSPESLVAAKKPTPKQIRPITTVYQCREEKNIPLNRPDFMKIA